MFTNCGAIFTTTGARLVGSFLAVLQLVCAGNDDLLNMSNTYTDNLYPIDKSTLPTVRFDPSDSFYLRLYKILQLVQCRTMQEVRHTALGASVLLVSALA